MEKLQKPNKKTGELEIKTRDARVAGGAIYESFYKTNKILEGIRNKSSDMLGKGNNKKFERLYELMTHEDFIYQCIERIRKNKGVSALGVDQENIDKLSRDRIEKIITRLMNGTYRANPVRRIMIPKPGKSKKRPLGITTFEDKVVQEMIRAILEAIYEPVFEKQDSNYGFRKGIGTHNALKKIHNKAQGMELAIEGDIEGAFDNVNHDTLLNILKEKIKDSKFINIISNALKSGLIYKGRYEHTLLGTPQGGIASPILFNIYMSKFDDFINNEIKREIDNINLTEARKDRPRTKSYNMARNCRQKAKNCMSRLLNGKNYKELTKEQQELYDKEIIKYHKYGRIELKTPVFDKKRKTLRTVYVRFADDWIFISNLRKDKVLEIKEKIAEYLQNTLKLKLSPSKTKITDLRRDTAKFLGFSMGYYSRTRRILTLTNKTKIKERFNKNKFFLIPNKITTAGIKKRTTGNVLIIGIDEKRVDDKLINKGFLDKKMRGRRKSPWTVLSDYEIVQRYNYMLRGLTLYYAPIIRDFSSIGKYAYILNYSCYHTLANKHHSTLSKIINKYGKPPTIELEKKKVTLLDYLGAKEDLKNIIKKKKEKSEEIDSDFLTVRINWRTAYKITKHCVVCGCSFKPEMHHIKHVKIGKIEGFKQVMQQLNRKQIMVCKTCHKKYTMVNMMAQAYQISMTQI